MNTTDRQTQVALPWLVDGEHLDRATFHERYQAMPEEVRAELIGGVVYMASPLRREHGRRQIAAIVWIDQYEEKTPGVEAFDNASVFFEDYGELQPDLALRILPSCGGRTRDQGSYIANGPELVVEIADSSLTKDLGPKLADYERAGVPEYVVLSINPPAVRWHVFREGRLLEVSPDPDGLYRSKVFPGLWLDPVALIAGDKVALKATVDRGLATLEHAEFVAKLAQAGGAGPG